MLELNEYLGNRNLAENLALSPQLSFHWANWDETCIAQRKHYKNFNNNYYLTEMSRGLLELKFKNVWLCNKVKVIKSDLYSLYESYLDSRLRLTWFERKDEILFSLENEQGPYYPITSLKWMDKELYTKFVMQKILIEEYTLRSFRLDANIPVIFTLNNNVMEYKDQVHIHQLSEYGIIFRIKDKKFFNKIQNSSLLEFKIPINQYKKVASLKFDEALRQLNKTQDTLDDQLTKYSLSSLILKCYGNIESAKRSSGEDFYIFARYEDLVANAYESDLKEIFKPLVEKTKCRFSENLEKRRF